jgi:ubiquinone/menaquinone biosynthesis C-methylase UbiE
VTEEVKASRGKSWSAKARGFVRFSALLFNPKRKRADLLYELSSTDSYLTERTLYRNVGYWKDSPTTLDDACEALARFAGEQLQLGPKDRLLDVGFGYGDQDIDWMQHFAPREIVGINITRSQIEHATKRVAERGLSDRIKYQLAGATEMPFDDNSFDKVVALESAFHFQTRSDFFREAFRVLRPGGRLVTVDIVPMPYDKLGLFARMISSAGLYLWKTCTENVYGPDVYEQKLREVGFDARVESIRDQTLEPFARYTMAELAKPERVAKMNYAVAGMLAAPAEAILDNPYGLMKLEYVLAVADKPAK